MKHFLLVILVLCGLQAEARKIHFTDSMNVWHMLDTHYDPAPSYIYFGVSYHADTAINSSVYRRLQCWDSVAIREDNPAGKIYCRFLSPRFRGYNTDTGEHLFFDYNLKVGDTFKVDYGNYHSVHYVQSMSTVMFGSNTYETWFMVPIGGLNNRPYTFVEGMGTLNSPIHSISNWFFEDVYRLLCFWSSGWRPLCVPAIGSFDNDSSCHYQPEAVAGISGNNIPVIYPNPVNGRSILRIPAGFINCLLSITNTAGICVVKPVQIIGKTEIPIGQYLNTPGIYYYCLKNEKSQQTYKGYFIFQ